MEGGGRQGLDSVEDEVDILLSGFQDLLRTSYNIWVEYYKCIL